MAIVNTKSTSITGFDDAPRSSVPMYKHKAPLLISRETAEVAAGDDDTSVYRMIRLPSNAVIKELNILNDAIAGGTAYDLGVYQTNENGGAVVNVDVFSSDISMVTARTLPLNAMYESAEVAIENGGKRLWEVLGLSADPNRQYDLCFTGDTVGTGAGTLYLECVWSH